MERTAKDIHQVLGNLRQRIDELSKGDYSKGYRNELPKVKANIDHFPPDTIIKFLSPLVQQLKEISEVVYQQVSDDPHEEINQLVNQSIEVDPLQFRNRTGESKRDLMRKEVGAYIAELDYYIRKYSKSSSHSTVGINDPDSTLSVIKYLMTNARNRKQNLENLLIALEGFIEVIDYKDFKEVFSGKDQNIKVPINWIGKENELHYFLTGLFKHQRIQGYRGGERINWEAVRNCFLHNGVNIDSDKVRHNTDNPAQSHIIDRILSNL